MNMTPLVLAFMVCGALSGGYAYALGFVLIVLCRPLVKRRAIAVNFAASAAFWLLGLFGLSYAVFAGLSFEGVQNMLILPLAAYAVGWCSAEQSTDRPAAVRDNILALAAGFALHAGLNCLVNIGHARGQLVDFWSGSYQTATGSGFLNTLVFSLFVYIFFLEKRRGIKALLAVLLLVCLLYMLMLGNRTQLVILLVASLLGGALLLRERGRIPVKQLLGLVFVPLLAFLCWRFDWLGLAQWLGRTNLALRLAQQGQIVRSNAERVAQFVAGVKNLYQHPFGGRRAVYYFHNMWLDIGRVSGLIPVVVMLLYNAVTVRHVLRLFRGRRIGVDVRYVLLCSYLGILVNLFVEPVLEGLFGFFLAFCALNGMTECLARSVSSVRTGELE